VIRLPGSVDEALAAALELDGEYRAGGSDLFERRRHLPIASERRPLVDLRDVPGLDGITSELGGARIGARTSLAALGSHPGIRGFWPGVAEAAGALANPQIRAVATVAGNLMQGPRCWYYRHPDYTCLRKRGDTCHARGGDHLWHVVFDGSPCITPHPSTLALALLAYEAEVEVERADAAEPVRLAIADVVAHGGLGPHDLITAILLGPALAGEQTAYVRASSREHAEWALAEVSVRLVLADDGSLGFVRVTAGAVAPTPLRLATVEAELLGQLPTPDRLAAAAAHARDGASPLAMTGYKLELLEACVVEALEQALARSSTPVMPTSTPEKGSP
jgi:xanthine dehydrogenase YagS FAD-binding subunit